MGVVFGAILVFWLIVTVFGASGLAVNPLGLAGGDNAVLFAILVLVTGGILLAATKLFTESPTHSTTGIDSSEGKKEALEALKRRYVADEIDETTFERKLETLFETETVADAERRIETTSSSAGGTAELKTDPPAERQTPQPATRPARRTTTRSRHGHCK